MLPGDSMRREHGDPLRDDTDDDRKRAASSALDVAFDGHYDELRELAHSLLRRMHAPGAQRTTSLLHDAYTRLAAKPRLEFRDQGHTIATIARAMRFALIDRLRSVRREQELLERTTTHSAPILANHSDRDDLLALDAAIERLSALDPRKARVVELRFFTGLSVEDTALALGVTAPTVKRDYAFARAWLARAVNGESVNPAPQTGTDVEADLR